MNPDTTDRYLTGLLVVAAVTTTFILVQRELQPSGLTSPREAAYIESWREVLPASRLAAGDPGAPITVVEFSDFECPVCGRFKETMDTVLARYPRALSYSFAHFPLPSHLSSLRAARAAECAAEIGLFNQARERLFANQGLLSAVDWPWLSSLVPEGRQEQFESCMISPDIPDMVSAGVSAGRSLGVTGTPTILLNGWRYPGMPAEAEFLRAIEELIAGRAPYPAFPRTAIVAPREGI